jgi:hypothetical protein
MWAVEFCNKRSNDCVEMAEECADAERRRAWLELAKEWMKLSEQVVVGFRHSGFKSDQNGGQKL